MRHAWQWAIWRGRPAIIYTLDLLGLLPEGSSRILFVFMSFNFESLVAAAWYFDVAGAYGTVGTYSIIICRLAFWSGTGDFFYLPFIRAIGSLDQALSEFSSWFGFLGDYCGDADDYLVEDLERNWVLLRQAGRGRRAMLAWMLRVFLIIDGDGAMPLIWPFIVGPRVFLFICFIFFTPAYAGID